MNIKNNAILFWFSAARGYSIPISVMSWAVPFVFGVCDKGNVFYGILALIGIVLVHLGVNLFDDVIDYYLEKRLINKGLRDTFNFQQGKCQYIINGSATLMNTLVVASCLFFAALLIGLFLFLKCGMVVTYIVLITAALAVLYPVLTYFALGEVIVAIVFSPLLYLGTYFVMTGHFSLEMMIVSISTGLLTVGLLHTHTFMDFDFDQKNNKKTLCALVKTKENAVITQGIIMFLAFLNITIFALFGQLPGLMLLSLLAIPSAVSLYKLLNLHIKNPSVVVEPKFWMGPMENWEKIKENKLEAFMVKFLLARNVMLIFSFFVCLAKVITEVAD